MKNTIKKEFLVDLLYMMYVTENGEDFDYDKVDDFYGYLGYDLEQYQMLEQMDINSTSELQELLENYTSF